MEDQFTQNVINNKKDIALSSINHTKENSKEIQQHLIYAAAVVANIRARLDKFYECYIDDKDLLKIWGGLSWLDSTGNLHDRIKGLARKMEAKVSWPKDGEAYFTRKRPSLIIGTS